jgi:cell division protein FtsN
MAPANPHSNRNFPKIRCRGQLEVTMRMIVLAALASIAIGLVGATHTSAAPISASVIDKAATATSPVTKVGAELADRANA